MSTSVRERSAADRGVADVTGMLTARRRHSRRRLALRIAVGVLVLALIGAAGWLVGFSSVFAAERVRVSGTHLLTAAAVERAAAVPLGTPLSRLDLGGIGDRVEALPAVASVTVERRWPHTVTVSVVERHPVVAVGTGGSRTLVDASGVAFATVGTVPTGVPSAAVPLGNRELLQGIAAVADALPASVRADLETIEADSTEAIRLRLSGNRTVVWGGVEQSAVKGQVLAALLSRKASVYDVSGPANPTTRG